MPEKNVVTNGDNQFQGFAFWRILHLQSSLVVVQPLKLRTIHCFSPFRIRSHVCVLIPIHLPDYSRAEQAEKRKWEQPWEQLRPKLPQTAYCGRCEVVETIDLTVPIRYQ